MTTLPPGTPLPSRRELRERERAAQLAAGGAVPTGDAPVPPTGEVPVPPAGDAPVPPPAPQPAAPSAFAPETPRGYAPSPAAPEEPSAAQPLDTGEVVLSRRQLRALREAQGLVEEPAPVEEAAAPAEEPPAQPEEPALRPRGRRAAGPPADAPPEEAAPAPVEEAPPVLRLPEFAPEPTAVEPVEAVAPVEAAEPDEALEPAEAVGPPELVEPLTPSSLPAGHWSRQAEEEDRLDTGDVNIASRDFGAPSATTNALILGPPTPDAPMSASGETLMTGSIQLPPDFAETGMTGQIVESGELDQYLDPVDVQLPATDSQPVRASHAVSIHTETGGSLSLAPQRGSKGIAVLIAVATTMAVLVFGILVLAIATGLL